MRGRRCFLDLMFSLFLTTLLAACGGGNSGGGNAAVGNAVGGVVSKGPLANGVVDIYSIAADGYSMGAHVAGSVPTDANGAWNATITGVTGPFIVIASGGSYVDEYTGITVNLTPGQTIQGVLPVGATTAAITPFSDALLQTARQSVRDGYSANLTASLTTTLTEYKRILGFDPINVLPPSAAQMANATPTQLLYAATLGGFSKLANNLYVAPGMPVANPFAAVAQLTTDFAGNGQVDGYGFASVPLRSNNVPLNTVFTAPADLYAATQGYLANGQNVPAQLGAAPLAPLPAPNFATAIFTAPAGGGNGSIPPPMGGNVYDRTIYQPVCDTAFGTNTGIVVTAGYNLDPGYVPKYGVWHPGVDCVSSNASKLFHAVDNGIVLTAGNDVFTNCPGGVGTSGYNTIAVWNAISNQTTLYLHSTPIPGLAANQNIVAGDPLGTQGSVSPPAFPVGSHLHLEVRNGKTCYASPLSNVPTMNVNIDPLTWLNNLPSIVNNCTGTTGATFKVGTVETLPPTSCVNGMTGSITSTRTCQANGTWLPQVVSSNTCSTVFCTGTTGVVFNVGAVETLPPTACGNGMTGSITSTRTCQANGTWSPQVATSNGCANPTCLAGNGATYSVGGVETIVSTSCGVGMTGNISSTRTCQANGTWSPQAVSLNTCTAVTCTGATGVAFNIGAVETLPSTACANGMTGSVTKSRTCQADGTWASQVIVSNTCSVPMPVIQSVKVYNFDVATASFTAGIKQFNNVVVVVNGVNLTNTSVVNVQGFFCNEPAPVTASNFGKIPFISGLPFSYIAGGLTKTTYPTSTGFANGFASVCLGNAIAPGTVVSVDVKDVSGGPVTWTASQTIQ